MLHKKKRTLRVVTQKKKKNIRHFKQQSPTTETIEAFDRLQGSNYPSRVQVFKGTSAQVLLDQIQSFLLSVVSLQNQSNSFWGVRYGGLLITTIGLIRKKIEDYSQAVS